MDNIETEEDYNKTLKIIDSLIDCDDDSEDFKKLEHLSILVDEYENKHYKI